MVQNKKSLPVRVLSSVAKQFGYDLAPKVGEQSSLMRLMRFMGFTMYSWGSWDNQKFIEDGFMANAGLYSIINRITKTAAISPFKVFRVKDEKKFLKYKNWTGERATEASIQKSLMIKNQVYEEDNTHPLNELINRPNKWQRNNEFIQTCIGFKLITGNRFLFLNVLNAGANAGKPYEVYNLPPQHMTIVIGGTLWEVAGYKMQLGTIVDIPKELVIHSRFWNPHYDLVGSYLWGLSPLKAASKTIERSNMAEQRGVTMLRNSGAQGVMFEKGNAWKDLSEEQREELKKKLNEEILGLDNAGKIQLANGDMGYLNFGLTAVEMEVMAQEKYSDEKIANIYGVPPGLFMASANATDNNIKAWNKQLITQAVIPALCDLRDDWNEIAALYKDSNLYVDFDLSVYPELQEDIEKTSNVMQRSWWLKGNEKRLAMGYDEDPDEDMMDKYLVPATLTDINDLNPDMLGNLIDESDTTANRANSD